MDLPATLSTEPARYELKIPCEPYAPPVVQAWIRLHPAHWRVTYPPRQVNSLYFDTLDYQSLDDNLNGVGERRKVRLRWYGATLPCLHRAQLELKCKRGLVGWKEIVPLPDLTLDLTSPWSALLPALREQTAGRARLWLEQAPVPTLLNFYQRAYYATPDQQLRLTLDWDLTAYPQALRGRPNLTQPAPLSIRVLLELKAPLDRASSRRLATILAQFPARLDRHSKYVQGVLSAPELECLPLL